MMTALPNGRTRADSKVVHTIVQGSPSKITHTPTYVHACGAPFAGYKTGSNVGGQLHPGRTPWWWKPWLLTMDAVTCPRCLRVLDGEATT